MRIEDELAEVYPDRESVLTVGVLDGVHKGHLHLISRLKSQARETGRLAGVVTFRNHPEATLNPDFRPCYLTTIDDRLRLIRETGVDFVVPVTFNQELARLRVGQFARMLQGLLRMSELVVGPDFAMGYKREGDVDTLAVLGREMGFSLYVVEPLTEKDCPINSTIVRKAVGAGDVTRVARLLGRNFVLPGSVVKGVGRGGPLGFPTANLSVSEGMAIPGNGVYATWAKLDGRCYMAATNVGTRPTFGTGERAIEACILDYEGDLYGRQLRLEFVQRLRDEVKYESVRNLREQVKKDIARVRAVLRRG